VAAVVSFFSFSLLHSCLSAQL